MIHDYKFYERQSALAAVGQLSDADLVELEQHAKDCASCRQCIADMARMSREFFLMHARKANSTGTPEGMQERFLERAANAGIPVSRPASVMLDLRFARAAAIAVLLTVFLALSWKVFTAPGVEKVAMQNSSTPRTPNDVVEGTSVIASVQAVKNLSAHAQFKRRPTAWRRAVSTSSTAQTSAGAVVINRPVFALQDLPASLFDRQGKGSSEEHAFHYDLKLAPLSFLESSLDANSEPHISNVRFSAPVFHLDPNRAW